MHRISKQKMGSFDEGCGEGKPHLGSQMHGAPKLCTWIPQDVMRESIPPQDLRNLETEMLDNLLKWQR